MGGKVVQLSDILKIIDIRPGWQPDKILPASDAGDGVTSVPILLRKQLPISRVSPECSTHTILLELYLIQGLSPPDHFFFLTSIAVIVWWDDVEIVCIDD